MYIKIKNHVKNMSLTSETIFIITKRNININIIIKCNI